MLRFTGIGDELFPEAFSSTLRNQGAIQRTSKQEFTYTACLLLSLKPFIPVFYHEEAWPTRGFFGETEILNKYALQKGVEYSTEELLPRSKQEANYRPLFRKSRACLVSYACEPFNPFFFLTHSWP